MNKIKKYLNWGVILVIIFVGGYWIINLTQTSAQAVSLKNIDTVGLTGGEISASVSATGEVRANQTGHLYWLTTGVVAEVFVSEGDQVQAGQVLATLKKESLPAEVIEAESILIQSQQDLDNLMNSKQAQAEAYQDLVDAKQETIDAQNALDDLNTDQYQEDLDTANEDVADAQDSLQQSQEDFDLYKSLDEDNQKRVDAENALDDAKDAYDDAVQVRDLLVIDLERADGLLAEAQAHLEDAQREYDRLKDGPDPEDVSALQAKISSAQANMDLISIKAAYAGMVSDVNIKPGDQIMLDKIAFRLDDISTLYVDLQVSEVDINQVYAGQLVTLTLDAIPMKEYHGKVVEVARTGLAQQGVVDFVVTVALSDADQNIRPGMTAAGEILVNRLDAALLVPNQAVRVTNGSQVVFVVGQDNTLQAVKIVLGESSDSYSEVISGNLKAGDQIALNPPDSVDSILSNEQPLLARKMFKSGSN